MTRDHLPPSTHPGYDRLLDAINDPSIAFIDLNRLRALLRHADTTLEHLSGPSMFAARQRLLSDDARRWVREAIEMVEEARR